jgi:hypothetical protein
MSSTRGNMTGMYSEGIQRLRISTEFHSVCLFICIPVLNRCGDVLISYCLAAQLTLSRLRVYFTGNAALPNNSVPDFNVPPLSLISFPELSVLSTTHLLIFSTPHHLSTVFRSQCLPLSFPMSGSLSLFLLSLSLLVYVS